MKFLSLFSGIGAPEKALENMGVPFELVGFCELDKYAVKSYCAIHGVDESMNLGDITKVDETKLPKDIDICCYGFPCQDISVCGRQKGLFNEDGSNTRSGLFFEAWRIIEATKPKIAIAENVKNLLGKGFTEQFQIVLASLEAIGYTNYYKVLNAKDFGVPQNRERVFIVSIRNDVDTGKFEFPEGFPLKKRLKDVLEYEVDEEFYLSEKIQDRLKITDPTFTKNIIGTTKGEECTRLGERDRVYNVDTVMAALNATDYKQPKQIAEPKPVLVGGIGEKNFGTQYRQGNRIYDSEAIAMALGASPIGNAGGNSYLYKVDNLRIRKLTPKECFRLMGFDDESFHKAETVNSNTQLYKQAGNSIVVNVLEHLFCSILDEYGSALFGSMDCGAANAMADQ